MVRSFGVEEELLLVRADGRPVPAGDRVVGHAPEELEHEFKKEQTEIGSDPCTDAGSWIASGAPAIVWRTDSVDTTD
jgi:gamma-glutamyl:cysteine ligase YbdK (ATP-grasp superfamily)